MQLFMQISISFALGIAGLTVIVLGVRWLRSGGLDKRLVQYVETPLQTSGTHANVARVQPRVITGSFFSRTVTPAIKWVGGMFGRITPSGAIDDISHKLLIAGNPMRPGSP